MPSVSMESGYVTLYRSSELERRAPELSSWFHGILRILWLTGGGFFWCNLRLVQPILMVEACGAIGTGAAANRVLERGWMKSGSATKLKPSIRIICLTKGQTTKS